MVFITNQKNQLTITQIVLETIQQIRELCKSEFRGGYIERKYEGDSWHDVYIPDVRQQVIQSIDFLRMLVQPKFDKIMQQEYDSLMTDQQKNYDENAQENLDNYIVNKLRIMLKLFEKINLFFEREHYFKAAIYREGEDEEDKDE